MRDDRFALQKQDRRKRPFSDYRSQEDEICQKQIHPGLYEKNFEFGGGIYNHCQWVIFNNQGYVISKEHPNGQSKTKKRRTKRRTL